MSRQSSDSGDTLVRVGGVVFGIGTLATLVTFVPYFFDLARFPSAAYWLSMLMPLGLLVSLVGLLAGARAQSRRRRAAREAAATG
ncbi:hypothetical protein [Streptomyces sp. TLI_171]|uniref:hypothetical protein n=1 Tax=Streptomyces sp. TLI_171 TaxID=1938859 RepID=UPI000C1933B0|nr:hypothetical protein [Streptomyces sp. TLI_171]RKE20646.1 hypothetical protein BX266_4016 [Streptomyces sp. TLI_171]